MNWDWKKSKRKLEQKLEHHGSTGKPIDPSKPMIRGPLPRIALPAVIGRPLGTAAHQEILASCRENESPEFIIGAGAGGVLAAFKDRCIVVKKGGLTSFMTGATGGGRTTVFNYADIVSIEVNAGWITATVEILTASHDAGRTKDYWHVGGVGGGNQDAWKMPNVLALNKSEYDQARTHIDWIRTQAAVAKRTVVVANQPESQPDMADQIRKLTELRDQGALTEAEFTAAKAGILAKNL